MTAFRFLLIVVFTIIFAFILGYIDFVIITPLVPLPEDIYCYHEIDPPLWIDLFYLDNMGHPEPPFSGLHMFLLLAISAVLGIFAGVKIDKWLSKKYPNS
ncbi:MAG: hypothetical protein FWC39_08105 [Bacteroidetes bacterium]|nr:hypothetical protein [Bacteroidota bacterium]